MNRVTIAAEASETGRFAGTPSKHSKVILRLYITFLKRGSQANTSVERSRVKTRREPWATEAEREREREINNDENQWTKASKIAIVMINTWHTTNEECEVTIVNSLSRNHCATRRSFWQCVVEMTKRTVNMILFSKWPNWLHVPLFFEVFFSLYFSLRSLVK